MRKPRAPKVDKEGLAKLKELTPVDALTAKLRQFERQRKAGTLPKSFIALEAMTAFLGARMEGHSDAELRRAWPDDWGQSGVLIPQALLQEIASCWMAYKAAPSATSLGEAFRLEPSGQGRQPTRMRQQKRERRRSLAVAVEKAYVTENAVKNPTLLEAAYEMVAHSENVSFDSVRAAYKEFRTEIREEADRHGLYLKG